jgi:thioredoxin-related protein
MAMRRLWRMLAFALCVAPAGCGGRLPWRSDWQRALAEAQFEHKPSVLMFSAALCPRCWKMDKEVFTDPKVREELANYQLVRIDFLTHRNEAEQFEFTGTPSFVVYSATGRILGKYAGAMDAQAFLRFLGQSRLNR